MPNFILRNLKKKIKRHSRLKDYLESSKAKVNFIHASYGFGKINEDVYKINSLKELVPLVDKIFKNN